MHNIFNVYSLSASTDNYRLSGVMWQRKDTDNPNPCLKQKQTNHGTKWI